MSLMLSASNRNHYLIGLLFCALASCAPGMLPPTQVDNPQAPADFPEAYYLQAKTQGKKILRIDSSQSLVVIEVHRTGLFARMGHDHIVASHNVKGYANITDGLADLYLPLEQLVVDEPDLRRAAGFNSQPSREDIEGTRSNMLTKTLDSAHFPYALIHIVRADTSLPVLNVSITLHGKTHTYEVPAKIETVQSVTAVDGKMSLNQTDFGITPLSVFGGMLQVQDRLELRFHIMAQDN